MEAIPLIAALVFVAELGDKSQLLALSFATRYPGRSVLAGLALAAAAMHALAVTGGVALSAVVPGRAMEVGGGLLFLAFGIASLRGGADDGTQEKDVGPVQVRTRTRTPVLTVAGGFLLAELGDKTMLASLALAATYGALPTWIGATLGMFAASALAVVAGRQLASRIRPQRIRIVATAVFLVVGALLLAGVG